MSKLNQVQIFEAYPTNDLEKAKIRRLLAAGGWIEADEDGGYYAVHQDRDGGRSGWGTIPIEAINDLVYRRLGGHFPR